MTSPRSVRSTTIVLWALTFGLAAAGYGFWIGGGWSENGAVLASRYTARLSFYWFIAAWSASSLAQIWRGGWRTTLLARRRAVGLGFAAVHSVHFVALIAAIAVFGHESDVPKTIGGGIGYLFVAAMAATSNDASVRALGAKRWKLLHTTGGWVVFAIFLFSYSLSVGNKPEGAGAALVLMATALALRLIVAGRKIRRRASPEAMAQASR